MISILRNAVSPRYSRVKPSSLRPAACPRDPEIHCQSEISGSRGQAAGRRPGWLPCYIKGIRNAIFLLISFCFSTASANSFYPLDTEQKSAQFNYLLKDLRCLVCQNQDLADSNAQLAKDLRQQVYVMVKEGKSDTEIRDYLTARYGDFILFSPPVKFITLLLWFGPLLFLGLGLFIFLRSIIAIK